MNARNQLLVVLMSLLLVCSSGAMVVGAAPASVSEHDQVDDNETDVVEEDTANDSDGEETVAEDEPADEGVAEEDEAVQAAYVNFTDQATEGETVVVDNVSMASGGFVTIHDSSLLAGNAFESVIGTSAYLEAGAHENVEVALDEPLEEDETLIAMAHRDTNANQTYDFIESEGAEDIPYLTAADEPVTDEAVVTIGEATEEPVQEEPVEEEPVQEEPNETEEPVQEEPVQEEPNETEEPVQEEPVEEEPVQEEPAEEEPVAEEPNETEEPVQEEPVEEEPVEEEPAEEEPEEGEDRQINVIIEDVTIFVFMGQPPDGVPADEGEHAMETDGVSVENGNDTAADTGTDATDESTVGAESSMQSGDHQIDITIEQAAIVPGHEYQSGMDNTSEETDTSEETADEPVQEQHNETDEAAQDHHEANASGETTIVIEQATVFVFIEEIGELPQQPVEEEPAEEEPVQEEPVEEETNETEEPVQEEPVEEEPVQEEPNETEEPVQEEPVEEEPNETEEPVQEEPVEEEPVQEEPNETEEPVQEEPVEEEPAEEEPNETEEPVQEEPAEEEPVEEAPAQGFTVENLQAPETAEVGETITVTATVSNPTDEERTEPVQFRLDGDLVDAQELTLEAGQTSDVQFDVDTSDLEPGQYVHMVLTEFSGEVSGIEITAETSQTDEFEGDLEEDNETVDDSTNASDNESDNASASIAVAN